MYFGCHINQSDNRNEAPLLVALHEIPHKKNIAIEFSMCLIKHGANVNDESIHDALQIKDSFGFVRDVHLEIFNICIEAGLKIAGVHWINDYLTRNYDTSTSPIDMFSHISEEVEVRFSKHRTLQEYLKYLLSNPLSLKKICFDLIREHLMVISNGSSIYFKIAELLLPSPLLKSLKLKNVKF